MAITFRLAREEDIEIVITLQNNAFFDVFKQFGICPCYNRTLEEMSWIIKHNKEVESRNNDISYEVEEREYYDYIILYNNLPVGNIIIKIRGGKECHISSLCVISSYHDMGIGSQALQFIEEKFYFCNKITLETPADQERNLIFYLKNGFQVAGEIKSSNIWCTQFEKTLCF